MILTGPEIKRQVELGNIVIDPFDHKRIGPNSYNCKLGSRLLKYNSRVLSTRSKSDTTEIEIPEEGYTLEVGEGYLGCTMEHTECKGFVPIIDGRSSTGRLFLLIHCTAGFGDDGFKGNWTLEIVALVKPVIVYPGDEILQIRFHQTIGERKPYKGRYQNQDGPIASRIWQQEQ